MNLAERRQRRRQAALARVRQELPRPERKPRNVSTSNAADLVGATDPWWFFAGQQPAVLLSLGAC
jgi:hypothetical protein